MIFHVVFSAICQKIQLIAFNMTSAVTNKEKQHEKVYNVKKQFLNSILLFFKIFIIYIHLLHIYICKLLKQEE